MEHWTEGLFNIGGVMTERLAIREPVWGGRKIGIAAFRANRAAIIEVKVKYVLKKADGKELLPTVLTIPASKVLTYPVQIVGGGTKLHLVPLSDMVEKG